MVAEGVERLKDKIARLRRGRSHGRTKPHKLVMLLAVIDMIEENSLYGNRVYLNGELIARFQRHFERYRRGDDMCQPGPPFFHLRTSGFWHHKIRPGREAAYSRMTTSGGGLGPIVSNIEYAYLDDCVVETLHDPSWRREVRNFIEDLLQMGE